MTLRKALESLGSTEKEIASKVPKGYINDPYSCPVANYLQRCGLKDPVVSGYRAWTLTETMDITYELERFIKHFDEGMYPELISGR